MRPSTRIICLTAATVVSAQRVFDTFEQCKQVCSPQNGCASAAYATNVKLCSTYQCILPQFESPEGIEIYRASTDTGFSACDEVLPLPPTSFTTDENGCIVIEPPASKVTQEQTKSQTSPESEDSTALIPVPPKDQEFTGEEASGEESPSEEELPEQKPSSVGDETSDEESFDGEALDGNDGASPTISENETSDDKQSSTATTDAVGSDETTETSSSISGAKKVMGTVLPILGVSIFTLLL